MAYNFIGKVESFDEDLSILLKKLNPTTDVEKAIMFYILK